MQELLNVLKEWKERVDYEVWKEKLSPFGSHTLGKGDGVEVWIYYSGKRIVLGATLYTKQGILKLLFNPENPEVLEFERDDLNSLYRAFISWNGEVLKEWVEEEGRAFGD